MKEQYIKQVEKELSLPRKMKKEVVIRPGRRYNKTTITFYQAVLERNGR